MTHPHNHDQLPRLPSGKPEMAQVNPNTAPTTTWRLLPLSLHCFPVPGRDSQRPRVTTTNHCTKMVSFLLGIHQKGLLSQSASPEAKRDSWRMTGKIQSWMGFKQFRSRSFCFFSVSMSAPPPRFHRVLEKCIPWRTPNLETSTIRVRREPGPSHRGPNPQRSGSCGSWSDVKVATETSKFMRKSKGKSTANQGHGAMAAPMDQTGLVPRVSRHYGHGREKYPSWPSSWSAIIGSHHRPYSHGLQIHDNHHEVSLIN